MRNPLDTAMSPGGFLTKGCNTCFLSQDPVTRTKQFLTKVNKLLVPVTAYSSSRLGTRLNKTEQARAFDFKGFFLGI